MNFITKTCSVIRLKAIDISILIVLLMPVAATFANVKTESSTSNANSPSVIESANQYLVKIAKANDYGLSINHFKELNSRGKIIVLANNYLVNPKLSDAPAKTIVLILDDKQSANIKQIRIEGRAADLVLLAPQGITCNGCSIINAERVTLATGSANFYNDELKSIQISPKGKIDVSGAGLLANESSLLDIAAGTFRLDAHLTTNMKGRVTRRANKEVQEIDSAGTLEVSNGDVQIIVGNNLFRYDDRRSDASYSEMNGNSIELTTKAKISVGNLHLESTYSKATIALNGQILVNGAWTYVGRYRDQSVVPLESIKVKSNGDILLKDQVIVNNRFDLDSTGSVYFYSPQDKQKKFLYDNIRANEINVVSTKLIENKGVIVASKVKFSSDRFINEGDIESTREIYINGHHELINQFGGIILGEDIHLKSSNTITNGSQYPWRLVFKYGDLARSRDRHTEPEIKTGGKLAVPPIRPNWEKQPVGSLAAFILGQNIKLEAEQFININPYEVNRDNIREPELKLSPVESGQVIVSSENILDLNLTNRLWNVSSILESWTGNVMINAPVIDNERYYLWADTDVSTKKVSPKFPQECDELFSKFPSRDIYLKAHQKQMTGGYIARLMVSLRLEHCYPHESTFPVVKIEKQYLKALSPPSRINVGDSLVIKSRDLNNKHSSIEVRKDVFGQVSKVWMEGLSLKERWEKTTTTHHTNTYCSRRVFRKCISRKTDRWTTSKTELVKDDVIAQYPFVFYVDGHIHEGFGTDYKIMQNITFGPHASAYTPRPVSPPPKPSKYIPITSSGITFFIPNPNFKE
ncbi:filamentous hemagglutinin N-terminal domain-containing protein [Vibrio cholerae]|uniref:two-partner secretion domain-containing protein n=1 Tax=Vibrio cholerae TaxID=666 RepID=UPI001158DA67|nr:filamentous hemagglutinin N-terminal domain-containing protein [Vibrio cholerae]TQP24913.1 filamentous hemagglutinin N-terminal domain-containing protein [Vibrio cholerae]TQP93391.1 filamentous hemagglutinin N-terminal domain-containing protein [Vibrio cholerae]TQQ66345.1 filamentous hemagglutinin N-terminal domain-containing protein [Vibrio cholerae]